MDADYGTVGQSGNRWLYDMGPKTWVELQRQFANALVTAGVSD
jgi:hypothetical protein